MNDLDIVRLPDAYITRDSGKAVLVDLGDRELWVPKSVIHDDSDVWDEDNAGPGDLVVAGWWARKNELAD